MPEEQLQYLNKMDFRMVSSSSPDSFIDDKSQMRDKATSSLSPLQKAQFVANLMVTGLLKDDFNQAIDMCTYLGNRMPYLKQVVCTGRDDEKGIQIEFIYDRDFKTTQLELELEPQEQTITFFAPKDYTKNRMTN